VAAGVGEDVEQLRRWCVHVGSAGDDVRAGIDLGHRHAANLARSASLRRVALRPRHHQRFSLSQQERKPAGPAPRAAQTSSTYRAALARAWQNRVVSHDLAAFVRDGGVVVLSGAGLSTGSGIPDYRGPTGRARPSTPMTYQEFTGSETARQRYWARSHLGWRFITDVEPNDGHRAVAALQRAGLLAAVVTQNVDGLHQRAGAHGVIDLHGALDRVICLTCGECTTRERLDERLREVNPSWQQGKLPIKPDGDVDLEDTSGFTVLACEACGGLLKPDVVFFGESVPRERVERTFALVAASSGLLVLGSSLTVMSGYRFVLRAKTLGVPVAIVNQGPTRGDRQADLRVDQELTATLTQLVGAVGAATTATSPGRS
jgi:NAD-dependent SIR2 family protein deacetylase